MTRKTNYEISYFSLITDFFEMKEKQIFNIPGLGYVFFLFYVNKN